MTPIRFSLFRYVQFLSIFRLIFALSISYLFITNAQARTIHFLTDNGQQESRYLFQNQSRTFVLDGWAQPVRNLDGQDSYVVYRFDIVQVMAAQLRVRLLNSFAISISQDGQTYTEMIREEAQGGSNESWKTVDLPAFISSHFPYLYVKIEHGAPERWAGGFGACLFEVNLELTDTKDLALAQMSRAPSAMMIDGQLQESGWDMAQPLGTMSDRFMLRPAGRKTTFRLCYDPKKFYISADCEQPGADQSLASAQRPDSAVYADECVEFFLQPSDQQVYYHLAVNNMGVVFDERESLGAESWDSGTEVATHRSDEGWTVEAAIPLKAMEAVAKVGDRWRVGLYRSNLEFAQWTAWSSVQGGGWHSPERFGQVVLVEAIDTALPAVNIISAEPGLLGQNKVSIRCDGLINTNRYELSLSVLPVISPMLPESQQDTKQMNPVFLTVAWPEGGTGVVDVQYPLDRFGAYHLVASVREKSSGAVVNQSVSSRSITPEELRPLEVVLSQPFVSIEERISASVKVNLREENLAQTRLVLKVSDARGNVFVEFPDISVEASLKIEIPVRKLKPGDYVVGSQLLDQAGKSLGLVENLLSKYVPASQPRKVSIGPEGVTYVDSQAILPLGFMLGGAGIEDLKAGYNVGLWGCESDSIESRCGTDRAQENGTFAILHLCNYLRGKNDFEGLRARVSRLRNEPGLLAWYLADEPEAYGDTPEILGKAYRMIKEIDPDHPVYIVTNSPGMVRQYKDCADIIGTDPYPIPSYSLRMVAEWTDAVVNAAKAHKQAPWMTPMGFGWCDLNGKNDERYRSPTNAEFSAMLYTCFIHGAKGIIWWPYSVPRTRYWDHFQTMGHQCRFLEPWILFGTDVSGMPSGVTIVEDVHWRAWAYDGHGLMIAANLGREVADLTAPFPQGITEVEIPFTYEGGKGETVKLVAGKLSLNLKPAEVKFFLFELP